LIFELILYSYTDEDNSVVGGDYYGSAAQTVGNKVLGALNKKSKNVPEMLDSFFDMVEESQKREYNGLTFAWGNLIFHGLVKNANVNFSMFMPNGTSAMATVAVELIETPTSDSNKVEEVNNKSGLINKLTDKLSSMLPF
jgi:hypothetical protein